VRRRLPTSAGCAGAPTRSLAPPGWPPQAHDDRPCAWRPSGWRNSAGHDRQDLPKLRKGCLITCLGSNAVPDQVGGVEAARLVGAHHVDQRQHAGLTGQAYALGIRFASCHRCP